MYLLEEADYRLENIKKRNWEYPDISYWINPKDGCCNATIEYNNKKSRLRAGILILKCNKVLLCEEADEPGVFSIPGGGLNKYESPIEAAIREAKEEVGINVKNAIDTKLDYCECHDDLKQWVIDNVPKKERWYNYYTCLIIGEYDSDYTGKVADVDKDTQVKSTAKWYDIAEAEKDPSFKEQWKKAIKLYKSKNEAVDKIQDSKRRIEKILATEYDEAVNDICNIIYDICNENNIDITITGADFTGSQRFGQPKVDSDLDFVITYTSPDNFQEYALFNLLAEQELEYNGYKLDINPIEDGDIDTYIAKASTYTKEALLEANRGQLIDQIKELGYNYNFDKYTDQQLYRILQKSVDRNKADAKAIADYKASKQKPAVEKPKKIEPDFEQLPLFPNKLFDSLHEDTRLQLTAASRNAGPYKNQFCGKNRWERKKFSKVSQSTQQYNKIDMNTFFKQDLLELKIPVQGETDNYEVTMQFDKVCEEISKNIKNNKNVFEYKCVVQALTKIFNTSDIRIKCSCDDFKYRFAHWAIVNNYSTDDTSKDPGPGKGIANPNNDKGKGCKHCLAILSNQDWIMKLSNVIRNYILYMGEHKQKLFLKFIFPKLYGVTATAADEVGLVAPETDLETSKDIIDTINDFAKNKGKYKAGSNKNTATGKIEVAEKENNKE